MTNNSKYYAIESRIRATQARQEAIAATSTEQRAAWIEIAEHWDGLADIYDKVATLPLALHGMAA